jgi:short-subunit dehydrogenase
LISEKNCFLIPCDFTKKKSVQAFAATLKKKKIIWDAFISCAGYLLPAKSFFDCNIDEWIESVHVNGLEQLRALHLLYPLRNKKAVSDVVYFAGGGADRVVKNITAYAIAKIILMKMCEYLDAENKDLNVFIVGPGWVKTKIHDPILKNKGVAPERVEQTKRFVESNGGTDLAEIFECIQWLREEGRELSGGRNFSVVYDPWRKQTRQALLKEIQSNPDMYKLRRHKNGFMQPEIKKV